MTAHRRPILLTALLSAAMLAGCGGQPASRSAVPAPSAAGAAAPTATQAAPPTTAPATAVVSATAGAPAAPTAAGAPTAGVAAGGQFADIPQGRTAEGYHVLGAADAPVTLVMYSDFL